MQRLLAWGRRITLGLLLSLACGLLVGWGGVVLMSKADSKGTPCQALEEFTQEATLILFDRTSDLSASAVKNLSDGLHAMAGNERFAGRVTLAEFRENDTNTEIIATTCWSHPPLPAAPPGYLTWLLRLWVEAFQSPSRSASSLRYPADDVNMGTRMWAKFRSYIRQRRDEEIVKCIARSECTADPVTGDEKRPDTLHKVLALARMPRSTPAETALLAPIIALVKKECGNVQLCNLFIFSDLLDSEVRAAIRQPETHTRQPRPQAASPARAPLPLEEAGEQARRKGATAARKLAKERGVDLPSTRLTVVAWGLGETDAKKGQALSRAQYALLRAYWVGFFECLQSKFGRGSEIYIDQYFPSHISSPGRTQREPTALFCGES